MLRFFKLARLAVLTIIIGASFTVSLSAAPYGAVVMDARDGRVIYARNATQPLAPASLTKMMTLYIAFSEVEAGRISLEADVPISAYAASQPPSKIGLRAGTTMKFKYLLRAAAVKSANDASVAIAEAIGGSEANFANYMTQTARMIGMNSTQFKNPHGLSQSGHYSTPMDMAILGRHIIYDYPRFYNLFSRQSADTPIGSFQSSNVRFLRDYPGADGIKTGYTNAAGYNLVGTAVRGGKRVIVSMFGGQSSYQRNEQVGALLDLGFQKSNTNVKVSNIGRPRLPGIARTQLAAAKPAPAPAPTPAPQPVAKPAAVAQPAAVVQKAPAPAPKTSFGTAQAPDSAVTPATRVAANLITNVPSAAATEQVAQKILDSVVAQGSSDDAIETPPTRPGTKVAGVGGDYSIQAGAFDSKSGAENFLIEAAATGTANLSSSKSKVIVSGKVYRARFSGLSKKDAYGACAKISAKNEKCYVLAPS